MRISPPPGDLDGFSHLELKLYAPARISKEIMKGTTMICWHCHWGMSKPVKVVYEKYLALLGGDDTALNYGPGHIVWDDENMDDEAIQRCIDDAEKYKGELSDEQFKLAVESLKELKQVPDIWRLEPEDYDGEHPEKFPPPEGW